MKTKFRDRTEAGELLAEQLTEYANKPNVLVLALPRGGVLARGLERDHLVASHAPGAIGDSSRLCRPERQGCRARIEHDEVVAEAIHLAKGYGRSDGHFFRRLSALIWRFARRRPV